MRSIPPYRGAQRVLPKSRTMLAAFFQRKKLMAVEQRARQTAKFRAHIVAAATTIIGTVSISRSD